MCWDVFYDVGHSYGSIQARGSMLLFVAAFLTFMAIGGFPSFIEDMKIFGRERLNGHYGVGAFVIGNTLSSIPYLLLISLIPGAMAYYLTGLQKSFEHFAYFVVLLFVTISMYYIAFHKYANQGFYKNEFEGLTFPNNIVGRPPTITGDEILRDVWEIEMG